MSLFNRIFIALLIGCTSLKAQEIKPDYVIEARNHAAQLQSELKFALQAAIRTGGFEKAVEACHLQAPKITQSLSDKTGWTIRRTSLKPRNVLNQPTELEVDVMSF